MDDLVGRISACDRRCHRLWVLVVLQVAVLLVLLASELVNRSRVFAQSPNRVLTVRELVVVDDEGVIRARIGSNLPDAVIDGKRRPRGQQVAGILLYDDRGQERGGYVTFSPSGYVALTLDTRKGQSALFAAGPEGGSMLQLWHGDDRASGIDCILGPEGGTALRLWHGDHAIDIRADGDGPRFHIVQDKAPVFHEPPAKTPEKTAWCKGLNEAKPQYTVEKLLEACRARMPDVACRECLGLK